MTEEYLVPDLLGEVYGVRAWNVNFDGVGLGHWDPGKNTAICLRNVGHVAPELSCMCGFYAYFGVSRFAANGAYGDVVGLVRGWGRVSVADDGWRAQYAEIVAITDDSPNADVIAGYYGVSTISREEADAIARANTIPPELRPNPKRMVVEPPVIVSPGEGVPAHSRDHSEVAVVSAGALITLGAILACGVLSYFDAFLAWSTCLFVLGCVVWWRR